jgi:hypothetical protein
MFTLGHKIGRTTVRRILAEDGVCEAYEKWMLQVLRNLTDALHGFLLGKTHLIMDRDPIFTAGFRAMLRRAGATPVRDDPIMEHYGIERAPDTVSGDVRSEPAVVGIAAVRLQHALPFSAA